MSLLRQDTHCRELYHIRRGLRPLGGEERERNVPSLPWQAIRPRPWKVQDLQMCPLQRRTPRSAVQQGRFELVELLLMERLNPRSVPISRNLISFPAFHVSLISSHYVSTKRFDVSPDYSMIINNISGIWIWSSMFYFGLTCFGHEKVICHGSGTRPEIPYFFGHFCTCILRESNYWKIHSYQFRYNDFGGVVQIWLRIR